MSNRPKPMTWAELKAQAQIDTMTSEQVWERAIRFLEANAACTSVALASLRVLPGPDGSIDLHWESEQYELLINVPSDESAASFYGDDKERSGTVIKGTVDLSTTHQWLFQWMEQFSHGRSIVLQDQPPPTAEPSAVNGTEAKS